MKKERLDIIMTELGLAESRTQAQKLVMAGQVRVDGQLIFKPGMKFQPGAKIEIERGPQYVSRGGEKLEAALVSFGLTDLEGRICADIGASTGGFTDCLLQHGAGKVYAVDVGYGELHWRLRNDPRVVTMERTNARYLSGFPELVSLVTVDASFISLKLILPSVKKWFARDEGEVIVLIKPQFEAGRAEASRGDGVIHDPQVHRRVLQETLQFAEDIGFSVQGLISSPIRGPKGNIEFLARLFFPSRNSNDLTALVDRVVAPVSQNTFSNHSTAHLF